MKNMSASDSEGLATAAAFRMKPENRRDLKSIVTALSSRFVISNLLDESDDRLIFLAKDLLAPASGPDNLVKLKVIADHPSFDQKKLELFYLETRAAAKLSHKNIIKISEPEQIANLHFCAIQHRPDCESLRALLDLKAWLDTRLAADITLQISEALDYARARGVLHLKLQPENILIDPQGNALIADFGVFDGDDARWAQEERTVSRLAPYCSPEQAGFQDVDWRSDLYSLGIVLYEMLTDRVPFEHHNPDFIRHKHRAQMPEPPYVFRPDLPPAASSVVMSLLEKLPEKRPQSHEQLQSALNEIICDDEKTETELINFDDPILDIHFEDEILSAPTLALVEDRPRQAVGEEYSFEDETETQWQIAPTREPFEPPTITVIDPPAQDGVEPIHTTEISEPFIASQQNKRAPEKQIARSQIARSQIAASQTAPSKAKIALFLVLLLIAFLAVALMLIDRARSTSSFQNQTSENPAAATPVKENLPDKAQPPASSSPAASSSNEGRVTARPVNKSALLPSENSAAARSGERRSAVRTGAIQTSAGLRSSEKKPVVRTAQRRFKSYRSTRPAKRVFKRWQR